MHFFLLAVSWLFLSIAPPTLHAQGGQEAPEAAFDAGRNRLLAYILSQHLPGQHFSRAPLDDSLSEAAFSLYLRQLDPRKRFLLANDVRQLESFADHIDDELSRGRIVLPDAGMEILNQRVREVEQFIDPLLDAGFDPSREESLESDPEKLPYAATIDDLRERWRRILKYQVLDQYLDGLDAAEKAHAAGQVDAALLAESVTKVRKRIHHNLERVLQETRQDHYHRYFDAVTRAFDPHTNYMPPATKEDFDIHMSGSLEGIGALLREEDGLIKVVRITSGSAAERQGQLTAEDTILAVAERDGEPVEITDMRIREAVRYIRGPKGTEVRLTIQRPDGAKLVIPIIRDVVQIEETYVKSALLHEEGSPRIGYIRIPSFYRDFSAKGNGQGGRNATEDTRVELERLKAQGIDGLILDLRNNGGGALTDAVELSGLFLPGGPVVQIKNSRGMVRLLEDEDPGIVYGGPMIVLVNQFSASASEILAAALQDYGRALVVGGEHTHGKGTVQVLVDLNQNVPLLHLKKYDDLGALKLTIQKFYRINGNSTQFRGVTPDIVVPGVFDYLESGEQYLDNALQWDPVEPVDFAPWPGPRFDAAAAREIGAQWVGKSKKFEKIRVESDRAEQRSNQTEVAVSLDAMAREREELALAREEMLALGGSQNGGAGAEGDAREDQDLEVQLDEDPVVQMSVFLMEDPGAMGQAVGELR